MKRFFMMNIIFAAACVYLAYSAVNYSFEPISYKFKLKPIQTKQKVASQIVSQDNDKKLMDAVSLIMSGLETVEKKNQKVVKTFKKKIRKIVYKKLDFTPKKTWKNKPKSKLSKPRFIHVQKVIPKIKAKREVTNLKTKKVKIKKIEARNNDEFELSYDEVPEQGAFVVQKLNVIAWSKQTIDFDKINERAYLAQQEKINKDRISLASSAPERSSNNTNSNSMNFPMKSKLKEFSGKNTEVATLKKTKGDELEFFDYSEIDKANEIAQSENLNSGPEIIIPRETKKEVQVVAAQAPSVQVPKKDFDPLAAQSQIITSLNSKQPVAINNTNATLAEAVANIKKAATKFNAPKPFKKARPNPLAVAHNNHKKLALDTVNTEQSSIQAAAEKLLASENKDYGCLDAKDLVDEQTYLTKYSVSLTGIDYSKDQYSSVRNFDLRFHDDLNESKKDYGNGILDLEFKMSTQMSIRRGSIYSRGYYPTTVDLVFEAGALKANIPVFALDSFNSILSENNLQGLGAHLLVELDDKTEDVELDKDTSYEAKFYLNKKLKIVSRSSYDFQYVLFVGVDVGNTIINFRNHEDKMITKLIHLTGDEMYYEPNFYANVARDSFALYEENLLSKCKSIMNVDTTKVEPWSYVGKVKKQALNKLDVKKMIYPLGTRKYYELKHLEESIFVGRWSQESVIVPSEDYISHAISKFNLDQSDSKCIVQLNFAKPIREIAFNGQSGNRNMNMQINVLDKDGKFYDSFSEQSERVFLMGEEQGVISIKIDYTDGSKQFLQSYCSDSTYVVEQL